MHKYTMFLVWWSFLNLKPTLMYNYVYSSVEMLKRCLGLYSSLHLGLIKEIPIALLYQVPLFSQNCFTPSKKKNTSKDCLALRKSQTRVKFRLLPVLRKIFNQNYLPIHENTVFSDTIDF